MQVYIYIYIYIYIYKNINTNTGKCRMLPADVDLVFSDNKNNKKGLYSREVGVLQYVI